MLRITKQADYGIVLMTRLAADRRRRSTAAELAAVTQLPLPTVSKILKLLAREHLLDSHRGVKGGYALAADPHKISVAMMINVLDGPIAVTECIENSPGACSQEGFCRVRGNWQNINAAILGALTKISLADLMAPPAPLPPLVRLASPGSRASAS